MLSPSLPTKQLSCSGCGLCAAVCPRGCIIMQLSEEGFYVPHIDLLSCIGCKACEKACSKQSSLKPNSTLKLCYEVYVNDDEDRIAASSGGFCTQISRYTVRQGGYVYGVILSDNFRAQYVEVSSEAELTKLRGSKYIQADTCGIFKKIEKRLRENSKVLFIGTACNIKALRARFGFSNSLITAIDIACYGVPSYNLLDSYIRELNKGNDSILSILFKNKARGWRNNSVKLIYASGDECLLPAGRNPFIQGFDSRLCLNLSCYTCMRDPSQRISDITCADFWGHNDIHGDGSEKGVSCVICHTHKGVDALLSLPSITCKPIDLHECIKNNGGFVSKNESIPKERKNILKQLKKQPITPVIREYMYSHGGRKVGFKLFGFRIYLPESIYIRLRSIKRKILRK